MLGPQERGVMSGPRVAHGAQSHVSLLSTPPSPHYLMQNLSPRVPCPFPPPPTPVPEWCGEVVSAATLPATVLRRLPLHVADQTSPLSPPSPAPWGRCPGPQLHMESEAACHTPAESLEAPANDKP